MKKMIIRWLIEQVFDVLLNTLGKLAAKSSSGVDDEIVKMLKDNRAEIIKQIKLDLA